MVKVIELLRGEEGTTVTLELCAPDQYRRELRPGVPGAPLGMDGAEYETKSRTIVVTRGAIVLETLEGLHKNGNLWDYKIESDMPIRYVKIGLVNGSTVHDLRLLESRFRTERARAVILDFRSTRAVDLHHTVLLADALMDGGLIGRFRSKNHVRDLRADRDCLFRNLPLAVLVDHETQGGGEWIAAALQDSGRALIIGENTAGYAFVESTVHLPGSEEELRLATGIFERPSGKPFQAPRRRHDGAEKPTEAEANATGIRPDKIVTAARPADGAANVVKVVGDRIFGRRKELDPILAEAILAEAVREIELEISNGKTARRSAIR